MPPAVVFVLIAAWVERNWFQPPPVSPAAQVDTRLVNPFINESEPDVVLMKQDPEPVEIEADSSLAASSLALSEVQDDTVFRSSDRMAWFEIWETIQKKGGPNVGDAQRVSFSQLYGQPKSFRGRPVCMNGTLRRLEYVEAPTNELGIDGYWQGWLEPADGPASPVVIYFLEIPKNMPNGLSVVEAIGVRGFFFKRWAYSAKDTVRLAPLIMAASPDWSPPPPRPMIEPLPMIVIGAIIVVLLCTVVAIRFSNYQVRMKPRVPQEMPFISDEEHVITTHDALRRLEQDARGKNSG